jgi:hypothetical protein
MMVAESAGPRVLGVPAHVLERVATERISAERISSERAAAPMIVMGMIVMTPMPMMTAAVTFFRAVSGLCGVTAV